MIYSLYSVRDEKTCFASPFVDSSDESAVRGFSYAFEQRSGIMSFAPSDFKLYRIGQFDTNTGALIPEVVPVLVFDGASLFRKDGLVEE